jgi:hypothetical protein
MTPEVEHLRAALDRLLKVMIAPDGGTVLEQDEGDIIACLTTLQFIASGLYESRVANAKKLRAASC